jgi:uridylate kinase
MDNSMPIVVFNMSEPSNIMRVVCGEHIGTLVSNTHSEERVSQTTKNNNL